MNVRPGPIKNHRNIAMTKPLAKKMKEAIEAKPGSFWRLGDFPDISVDIVMQTFSRLCKQGIIKRYGKGLY